MKTKKIMSITKTTINVYKRKTTFSTCKKIQVITVVETKIKNVLFPLNKYVSNSKIATESFLNFDFDSIFIVSLQGFLLL